MSTTNPPEETMPDIEIDPRDLRHLADAQMNVELDTGDMILNLGPQHPATHGTLRVVVRLDGERVISADPVIGYMHRGYEKLTEFRTYPQITTLINRIDWLSSFANEVPFIDGAEKLMGVTAPPRAQYIRTMLTELSRIATFVLFLGEMSLQVGGITPAFFGFRDREHILNLIESATGGRFHPNFNRIGGIKDDLPWGWLSETRSAMQKVLDSCDDFEDLVAGNEIFQARTRSIGIIPGDLGATYGVSGSNLRASGVDWDLRRDGAPYLVYPELDFKVWTHPDGDSYARYMVRLQETRESARMVVQMLDQIPEGPIMAKVPRIIKVPEGEVWVETENPLGQMGYYIVSKGGTGPFRVKIRSASFSNVSILPWLLRGVYVPDVITILASLYFILGDIDR
ncbi:MAG: NADH:ubiquinone oxidoreductase 49 kD subunit 7 [Actinomycetia bacterium]|nr:NADH:ubiquinone oxidoreductase 49 kD subunit 7 [Actinomycetes bacterium]